MSSIVVHVTASFDLRMDEADLVALALREARAENPLPPATLTAALAAARAATAEADPDEPDAIEEPAEEPAPKPEPVRAARSARAARAATTNGASPPAPASTSAPDRVVPKTEPEMQRLLKQVSIEHPGQSGFVVHVLQTKGGDKRLANCDPSTWPDIADTLWAALDAAAAGTASADKANW